MNPYNIEDLLVYPCESACENSYNTNNPTKPMRTTELNFIEKIELEEFAKSKEAKELSKLTTSLREATSTISLISQKLYNLADVVDANARLLNNSIDTCDIKSIKRNTEEVKEVLNQIDSKEFATAIATLSNLFGIEEVKSGVDKKAIAKSLGFKA